MTQKTNIQKTTAGHPCHHSALPKLNRVTGQIEGVKRMIGESRYCPDIITQLRAARAAIKRVEADILETHLNHCVAQAIEEDDINAANAKIEELKTLFRRFEE